MVVDSLSDVDPNDTSDDEYQMDRADSASKVSNMSEGDISNEEVSARLSVIFTSFSS
jgi:hypothetical protein